MVEAAKLPQIFTAKTMHKRLTPKINQFAYNVYYLAIPLSQIGSLPMIPPLMNFKAKDHGARDGSDLRSWIDGILHQYDVKDIDEIVLVAMPRIFGYVFNPVSFWLCLDKQQNLRAVLCEVNNTFGETHSYLCATEDGKIIDRDELFSGEKIFHVSPFLESEGSYEFRFSYSDKKLGIWIDHYDETGEKKLLTSLVGDFSPMSRGNLLKHFFRYPMLTFKVIYLIHYQALKIVLKGIRYISKPKQKLERSSKVTKI